MYQEIEGNLISMALDKKFDVIAHGCNCFNTQKSGIAKDMAKKFFTDKYTLEHIKYRGDINTLGQIDYEGTAFHGYQFFVVNCYTQYSYGTNKTYLDYEALTLCMRKLNFQFEGKHIGLPLIGAGLAGGDWDIIKRIIQKELVNCNVTIVKFKP